MKILIVSHYYKHKNAMASVRPVKLAKYFSQYGHDVTVLTSLQKDNWCKQELVPTASESIREIYAPPHWGMKYLIKVYDLLKRRGQRKSRNQQAAQIDNAGGVKPGTSGPSASCIVRVKQFLTWLFYYSSDRLENYFLAEGLIKSAKCNKLKGFDVVIATYPGAGVHKAGEWFKKHKRTLLYIADYRDPAYNPGGRASKIELRHDKKVQDMAVKYADGIVCVSHGMAECLVSQYPESVMPPVYVVNNGFDPDDNRNSVLSDIDSGKFNFVYTGALYQGRRTVDMLAQVLVRIIDSGLVDTSDLAINYAGPDYGELISQLKPYGLESIAVDFGYVSREQSLGLQQQSDAVLLLNWNDDNYTGVIPGKLYEYMASRKPIVALIMGNKAGSESAGMIDKCGLGCACEQACESDLQKLEDYLKRKLTDFRNGVRSNVDSDRINAFEYGNTSKKYLDIIKEIKERK